MKEVKPETGHMPIKDSTEKPINQIVQVFPINSDPGKAERHRKEYLFGKGPFTLRSELRSLWDRFRTTDKRIDAIEDRLMALDGIAMDRHIASPPKVTEYHISEFLPLDEEDKTRIKNEYP